MKQIGKRSFALLLAALLLVSVLPLRAMAAELEITAPTTSIVFVGTKLGKISLKGGEVTADFGSGPETVTGEFTWKSPETWLNGHGVFYHEAIFTPTGAYVGVIEPQTVKVKVCVCRYTVLISELPTVSDIPAGSDLSASAFSGGKALSIYEGRQEVPGHFEWADGDEAMEIPGSFNRGIRFIPDDAKRYENGDSTMKHLPGGIYEESRVDVVVTGDRIVRSKDNKIVSRPIGIEQAEAITVQKWRRWPLTVKTKPELRGEISTGERLDCLKLEGGSAVYYKLMGQFVRGHFVWADGSETFDQPGEYTREIIFIPDNTTQYDPGTLSFERDSSRKFLNAAITFTVK